MDLDTLSEKNDEYLGYINSRIKCIKDEISYSRENKEQELDKLIRSEKEEFVEQKIPSTYIVYFLWEVSSFIKNTDTQNKNTDVLDRINFFFKNCGEEIDFDKSTAFFLKCVANNISNDNNEIYRTDLIKVIDTISTLIRKYICEPQVNCIEQMKEGEKSVCIVDVEYKILDYQTVEQEKTPLLKSQELEKCNKELDNSTQNTFVVKL